MSSAAPLRKTTVAPASVAAHTENWLVGKFCASNAFFKMILAVLPFVSVSETLTLPRATATSLLHRLSANSI